MWSSPTWRSTAWQQTGCLLKPGKLSTSCCMSAAPSVSTSSGSVMLLRLHVAEITWRPFHCWSFAVTLCCVAPSCVCCTRCVAGNCFSLQREHEAAVRLFQRALQLDPHMPYAGRCPCMPHCTCAAHSHMLHGGVPDTVQHLLMGAVNL